MHVGDAGASALAAALGRGALPRLNCLVLCHAGIGDAGMVGLAAAARANLYLSRRQPVRRRGHRRTRGAAAAGRCAATAGRCAAAVEGSADEAHGSLPRPHPDHRRRLCRPRAAALDSNALPALEGLYLHGGSASAAAQCTLHVALTASRRRNIYPEYASYATLSAALDSGTLPAVELVQLAVDPTSVDEVVVLLAAGLRRGGLPSLRCIALSWLHHPQFGDQAAYTLASALTNRAVPSLTSPAQRKPNRGCGFWWNWPLRCVS